MTNALAAVGHTPRSALGNVNRLRANAPFPRTRQRGGMTPSPEVAVLRLPNRVDPVGSNSLDLDQLADVLTYPSTRSRPHSRRSFLQLALHRLEAGHHVATRRENEALVECWWSVALDRSDAVDRPVSAPPGLLLYDPIVPTLTDGHMGGREVLDRLVTTADAIGPGATAYLAIPVDEGLLIHALVEAGATRIGLGSAQLPGTLMASLAKGWPDRGAGV